MGFRLAVIDAPPNQTYVFGPHSQNHLPILQIRGHVTNHRTRSEQIITQKFSAALSHSNHSKCIWFPVRTWIQTFLCPIKINNLQM